MRYSLAGALHRPLHRSAGACLLIISFDGPHCWRQWRVECLCRGRWGR